MVMALLSRCIAVEIHPPPRLGLRSVTYSCGTLAVWSWSSSPRRPVIASTRAVATFSKKSSNQRWSSAEGGRRGSCWSVYISVLPLLPTYRYCGSILLVLFLRTRLLLLNCRRRAETRRTTMAVPVDDSPSFQKRHSSSSLMQCGSIIMMVTFFVCGSLLSPLHYWRDLKTESHLNWGKIHETTPSSSSGDEGKESVSISPHPANLQRPPLETNFSGILAQPFDPWTHPLPCFPPDEDWTTTAVQNYPSKRGFLFVKPYKVGSSTTSGINLRIARNVAIRRKAEFNICKGRYSTIH